MLKEFRTEIDKKTSNDLSTTFLVEFIGSRLHFTKRCPIKILQGRIEYLKSYINWFSQKIRANLTCDIQHIAKNYKMKFQKDIHY